MKDTMPRQTRMSPFKALRNPHMTKLKQTHGYS